jgi:hypothetical protein
MAELLVRIKDKVGEDIYKDCQLTKRGDVITIQEDGWEWSTAELKNPEWQIIKYPKVSVESLAHFLAPEVDTNPDPKQQSKTLQRRMIKLDIDNLPSKEVFDYAIKVERTDAFIAFDTKNVTLDDYAITKAKVADPAIIGEEINSFL